ncbi:helix-turn-helix domain-containing protein [Geoglobus acetivorans]|uniref:DNA binding protein n=1 Tax=Geoglobus acetivorans TaxID=565033 RepID=A0A0A7GE61_GEOAI|nr:DNA binding protein [Geoglobus acetivorans]
MYVLTIDMLQYDCPFVNTSDDLDVFYFGTYWDFSPSSFIIRGYIISKDSDELQNAIQALQTQPKFHRLDFLSKERNKASVRVEIDYTDAMKAIRKNRGYIVGPFHVKNGSELWQVGFDTKADVENALRDLEENNQFVIKNQNRITVEDFSRIISYSSVLADLMRAIDELTLTEKSILKAAIRHGFYEDPRKINITKLARKFGISKAGISKNIRRAEKKVLSHIERIISIRHE